MKRQSRSPQIFCAAALAANCVIVLAQPAPCSAGYRIVARRYDPELRKIWEMRQDCLHPGWPARSVMVTGDASLLSVNSKSLAPTAISIVQPILVHAGQPVRLWSQDASVRIEITGTAEQSARLGERINIRIAHQANDSGITIQHIVGIVRAADDVEIAQ